MAGQIQKTLSPARQQRYLRRAEALCDTDPFLALGNIHRLLDGGVNTADVYYLQATLLLKLGCGTFAAQAAEKALSAGGDRPTMLLLLLKCYLTAYHRKSAAKLIPRILEIDSLPAAAKSDVAHGAQEIHQYELAESLYRELLDEDPASSKLLINLGYAFQKQGQMGKAVECYLQAIDQDPDSANAYKLLSSVEKQTAESNYLDIMLDAFPRFKRGSEKFVTAAYALGKTYEDLEDYERAFRFLKAGADAMRPKTPYSSEGIRNAFELTKSYFAHPDNARVSASQASTPRVAPDDSMQTTPLFILGMPRTGSTLVDRILSSHPDVVSMGELGCFKESMKILMGFGGGSGFHEHFYGQAERDIDVLELGRLYVDAAGPADFGGRYFIDKYPMNFMDLGLIAQALPNAKFVHSIRDPMDTCFSNFKQLFTLGFYHYSYSTKECAEYYLLYKDLMEFWRERLTDRILDIHYESLVDDTESQVRRLLDFLDLEWHDDCLNFHKNRSPVDTASLSQVRQPIYRSAIRHWTNYRPYLQDAIDVFRSAGIEIDSDSVPDSNRPEGVFS